MKKQKENGSRSAIEKQTTKLEVTVPIEFNSGLIGNSPPINLDITSLGMILMLGVLGLTSMLLEHQFIMSGVIFIIILCLVRTLPKNKIKALTEFIKSLPARLFP